MSIIPISTNEEVKEALEAKRPIVALESTIISHGMPYPENLRTATQLEAIIREEGAVPATIALVGGKLRVGLEPMALEEFAQAKDIVKVSRRDFARVLALGEKGATTVSATLMACQLAGLQFFATGGIGGVHRGVASSWDVSADLGELARAPVLCGCAGVKAILDIPKTLEYLETLGVPVLTWQSEQFPAFYSRESQVPSPSQVDTAEDVSRICALHWSLPAAGGVLLAVPIPMPKP